MKNYTKTNIGNEGRVELHEKQDVIEVFNFVRENNYELFKLFYDCTSVTLRGGNFENDTNRD